MTEWQQFFSAKSCALKICGVTTAQDAEMLVDEGIEAMGVNFWPLSKRFIDADDAAPWLLDVRGKILRVGVFVNAEISYIREIHQRGLIDVAQLHGDEPVAMVEALHAEGIKVIKAWGMKLEEDIAAVAAYASADGWLLDTPAPGVYGGTGEVFDWTLAARVVATPSSRPVILAGGIVPENAAQAVHAVRPAALDVASGAEISPGIKDINKVRALRDAIRMM